MTSRRPQMLKSRVSTGTAMVAKAASLEGGRDG
jgi:hypothetical protein